MDEPKKETPETNYPNGCKKCHESDEYTKACLRGALSPQEVQFLVVTAAMNIKNVGTIHQQTLDTDPKKKLLETDLALATMCAGKLLLTYDEIPRQGLLRNIQKIGVKLELSHGPCPHKAEEAAVQAAAQTAAH